LIEWPERLGDRLWRQTLKVQLAEAGSQGRRLTVSVPPSWEGRCPFQ
jgi:tRNA threonylcarbamoyladenosine biosynthesis protein TsaE